MSKREYMLLWRARNRESERARFKVWYERRKKSYYAENKDKILARTHAWLKTDKGIAYLKRRDAKEFERDKAQQALRMKVYSGKIKRLPCEVCGAGKSHAHHHDYSKPFDVRWLCAQHHHDEHAKIRST